MTKKKTKTYIENNPKSMLLIKSAFGQMKSFKMIPITEDCPYVECLFSQGKDDGSNIKVYETKLSYGTKTR